MAEKIQLEALPQHRLVNLADAALPGGARIRDDDIEAAEMCRALSKAARTDAARHVAANWAARQGR